MRWLVSGPVLSEQTSPLPEGDFLLPVCIDAATLNRLLTAAYYGAGHLTANGQESDTNANGDFTHLIPLLEAMAHIGDAEYTCEA